MNNKRKFRAISAAYDLKDNFRGNSQLEDRKAMRYMIFNRRCSQLF